MESNPQEQHQKMELPENLTEKDKELIYRQCELQRATSKEQIEGFATAYKKAKELAEDKEKLNSLSEEDINNLIIDFGELIEKKINKNGFRAVQVRFKDMSMAIPSQHIEQAIKSFSMAYAEKLMTPIEAYTEFEKIHPFADGNGRVGDLLWKMATARETGKWPEELPPDIFGNEE